MAANIKINANSSEFQRQMKAMSMELKKVGSSYNLANTQAKLFGSTTDVLKSKQAELTSKIKIQNNMITAQSKHIKDLNKDLENQKNERDRLNSKIEETNKKYKESVASTGKNSEESKKLKKELEDLKNEYNQNEKAIDSNSKKLDNAEIKLNNSKKALIENEKALQDINKELEKSKLDKFTSNVEKMGEHAENVSNKMKPYSVAITGVGVAATASSIEFEDAMAKVSTIADTTQMPLEDLKKAILELSNQTGISSVEIANNVYDAISAGQQTGDAVNFVSNSTKLAKAGFAEAGQSLDLLTTILNSYGLEAKEVTNVSDTLIQTQNLGKVTVGELASDMGKVIPTAKSLGVNLTQVSTGYALMTSKGIKSAETTTYMNSMLNELGKSGTTANKALKQASGESFQDLIKSGKSVGDILAIMENHAKKSGKSLSDMFGSAEAGKAALILSTNSGKSFNETLEKMKNSAGATEDAFKKVSSTTGQDLKKSLNLAKNSLIEFGDVISPVISLASKALSLVTKSLSGMSKEQKTLVVGLGSTFVATNLAIGGFAKLSKGLSSNIKFVKDTSKSVKDYVKATKEGTSGIAKFGKGITSASKTVTKFSTNLAKSGVKAVTSFGKGILTVSKNIGSLSLALLKNTGMLVKNGLQWTLSKAKMIAYKTAQVAVTGATKAMALAQQGLNLVMSMNPIGLVIIALTSLGAIFVVLYNKCEWFRNGVNQVWSGVKNTFIGFSNFFKGAFKTDFTQTFGLLGAPLNSFFGVVNAIWGGIKGVFNGVITFLSGVFTGNWKKVFKGLSDIVSSIFGAIGGVIKAPINAAISGINAAIRGVNRISFTIPEWVPGLGGKHFGVHLPTIPALAEGGIVTKATMALVGEGKEHEAVIPLSKLDKLVTDSVSKVLKSNSSENEGVNKSKTPKLIQVYFQLGSKIVAQAIYDEYGNLISKNQSSRGIARGKVQHV